MPELITLEGDKVFPVGTDILSVTGKFYPKESIDGQLFGTLVVDSSILKYPYTNQLNGSDMEDISLNGDFVVDGFSLPMDKEIYPDVTLSGDEFLNGFSFGRGFGRGLGRGFGGLSRGLSRAGRGLGRGVSSIGRAYGRGFQQLGRGLSRSASGLSRSASGLSRSLSRGANQFIKAHTNALKSLSKGASGLVKGISQIVPSGQSGQQIPEDEQALEEIQPTEEFQSEEQIQDETSIQENTSEQISEGEQMNDNSQNEEMPDSPPEISGWGDIAQGLSQTAGQVPHPYGQVASLGLNILSQFDNKKKPSQNVFDIMSKMRTVPKNSKPVIVKKPNGKTSVKFTPAPKMRSSAPNFSADNTEKKSSLMDNKVLLIGGAVALGGAFILLNKGKKR